MDGGTAWGDTSGEPGGGKVLEREKEREREREKERERGRKREKHILPIATRVCNGKNLCLYKFPTINEIFSPSHKCSPAPSKEDRCKTSHAPPSAKKAGSEYGSGGVSLHLSPP